MAFEDKTLVCKECGNNFVFTAGEPARCRDCRDKRRRSRDEQSGERQMFHVVCAECGKDTEVPFEPKTDRPVYCRDCFNSKRAAHF